MTTFVITDASWRRAWEEHARMLGDQAMFMVNGGSGADRADSLAYFEAARVCQEIAAGEDLNVALNAADSRWRAYARNNNCKVEEVAKIKHGPYKGQSCLHWRWVSPDRFQAMARNLRLLHDRMVEERVAARIREVLVLK